MLLLSQFAKPICPQKGGLTEARYFVKEERNAWGTEVVLESGKLGESQLSVERVKCGSCRPFESGTDMM